MIFFKKTEFYLPFLIPSLLVFSRTLADLTVVIISILFLTRSFMLNEFNWLKHPINKFYLVFIFYLILINSPMSINFSESLFYSISFIRWPLFSLAIAFWIFRSEISLKNLIYGIVIAFIFFLSDIWYQYLVDSNGIFGLSYNSFPNRLSVPFSNNVVPGRFILYFFFILLTIYFFINRKEINKINFNYIFLILIIGLTSTFISGERVSFLIFFTSFLIFLLSIFLFRSINFIYFIYLITLIFLIFLIFFYYDYDKFNRIFYETIHKIYNFTNSDYGVVFNTSIEKWKNHIFFGGGLHQFKNIYPFYGSGDWSSSLIYHAHNLPLNLLVETGLIGLILFYSIIFRIFFFIISSYEFKKHSFLIIFNFILLYTSFFPFHSHFNLSHNWINASSWLIIGLILGMLNIYEQNNKN